MGVVGGCGEAWQVGGGLRGRRVQRLVQGMIRPIVIFPEPVLRQRGARIDEVDEEVRQLAADLIETMRAARGVGLAAQQVGVARQIAVVDVAHDPECISYLRIDGKDAKADLAKWMPLVFLNPQLEARGEREGVEEGCLSFPEIQGVVNRRAEVRAKLQLLDGQVIELETDGLLARALQHEADHLNGVLFTDRMSPAAKVRLRRVVNRLGGGRWLPEALEAVHGVEVEALEEGAVGGEGAEPTRGSER